MASKKFTIKDELGITINSATALINMTKITFGLKCIQLIEKMHTYEKG